MSTWGMGQEAGWQPVQLSHWDIGWLLVCPRPFPHFWGGIGVSGCAGCNADKRWCMDEAQTISGTMRLELMAAHSF